MHGGGVHWWRGAWLAGHADVYPAMTDGGFGHPAVDHGGARQDPPKAAAPALSPSVLPRPLPHPHLFSSKKFLAIALSFVFDKYCPILN